MRVPKKSDVPVTASYKIEYFTEHLLRKILIHMSSWTFGKGRYLTVGIALVALIVAVISSTHLKYGDANPGDPILWPDSQFNTDVQRINQKFPGVDQMWIAVVGKEPQSITFADVMRGMEGLKQHMLADPNVGFAVSIADLIKGINMLANGNDPKKESIPSDQQLVFNLLHLYSQGTVPGEWTRGSTMASRRQTSVSTSRTTKGSSLKR